ncbi:Scn10a [Symbiodinium necroappetens]|uniref:Scn10a protein n=1 Tax=Symbiodinium necroappetens TaxID=1628268 RepID=A0A812ZMK9_9DINO|nr:Scn10a [Symbiodinium necroappetens]
MSESDEYRANSYFGSLIETMLSLFMSISDGVSWENVISPLLHISPVWGILYTFYVSFIYFAVLNVLTAVFCQTAIESAQNDHATAIHSIMAHKESHLEKIRILFSELGDERSDVITYAMLERKMMAPETQRYFESLGLEIWDVWTFFKLLDHDQDGNVHLEQFLEGCLRLRGQASSVDVARLIHDQTWLISTQGSFQSFVETELRSLRQELRTSKAASPGPSRSPNRA